ncbi:hypothetical protein JW711_01190 [Candidatus Woesearchaeota archaeon]|nr:hypothetical protein [Candidatus Woesearchaeota archaeon]
MAPENTQEKSAAKNKVGYLWMIDDSIMAEAYLVAHSKLDLEEAEKGIDALLRSQGAERVSKGWFAKDKTRRYSTPRFGTITIEDEPLAGWEGKHTICITLNYAGHDENVLPAVLRSYCKRHYSNLDAHLTKH